MLSHEDAELAREAPRERLFDVLMRRLDAMAPYREGLREITAWLRREPVAALAMNQSIVNSMRFMLEAAGIDSQGVAGAIKLQGLAFAWMRIVAVWLDDSEPELSKTMAELDRELTRGERAVAGVERLDRFAAPFKAIALAAFEQRRRGARRVPPSPAAERRAARRRYVVIRREAPCARNSRESVKFDALAKFRASHVARNRPIKPCFIKV